MSYRFWKPYIPVAVRRAQAEKMKAKAKKAGQEMSPVVVEGRSIARTFWGKAWCDNLEAYSDYENRMPRGRAYVRNGSVVDLAIEPGGVRALVMGSDLYTIDIAILPLPEKRWASLAQECTGSISSLVELLQGKFSKAVMERICQPKAGLFPSPKEIRLDCSCPDWASMCKHVAATLYGVGARLDERPELLFTLRQVDANDLVTQAAEFSGKTSKGPDQSHVLADEELEEVFGLEMASVGPPVSPLKPGARLSKSGQAMGGKMSAPAQKDRARNTGKKGVPATGYSPKTPVKKGSSSLAGRKAATSADVATDMSVKKGASSASGKKNGMRPLGGKRPSPKKRSSSVPGKQAPVSSVVAPKTSAKKGTSSAMEKKAPARKSRTS